MPHGYHGQILHVDLSSGRVSTERPPESFYRAYLGGSAMGVHYLLKLTRPGLNPLGPDNVLAFMLGVTTGTPISGQSRMTAVAKSPLTGAIGDSQSGGFWPAELKFTGFDGIVIQGKARWPVYLWIKDGQCEIRDARHLWGKITGDVEEILQSELNDKQIEVLQIGPAGENLVRFAAIMSMSNRANGRTGLGAVMGSKNLKAVVVRGSQKPSSAHPEDVITLAQWGNDHIAESDVAGLAKYGTAATVGINNAQGGLPTHNWHSGHLESSEALDGTTMYDTVLRGADQQKQDRQGRGTCYGCSVRCKRVVEIKEGPYQVDPKYGGPEYETLATFGSYCGIDDLAAVAKANQLCNQYGMDTISCGATIAWAMECYENGLLDQSETDGLALTYGNAAAMVKLTEMIGKGEGLGGLLGLGSAQAASELGRGSEAFLVTSKGQELPAHMPHVKRSLGLIYAVNPFGADHQSSEHDPAYEGSYRFHQERLQKLDLDKPQEKYSLNAEKIRFALKTQYFYSVLDSVNLCQFVFGPSWQLYGPQQTVDIINYVTGWDVTLTELQTIGERRLNLLRAFNAREGIDRQQDKLPAKFFKKALKGGRSGGMKLDPTEFEAALDEYYAQSGWEVESGRPTRPTLESLDLGWVADDLGL